MTTTPALESSTAEAPEWPLIVDYLDHWAVERPGHPAVVFDGVVTSYQALIEQVDSCAAELADAGVGIGDRVAMLSTPRPEFLIVYLALARIGGVWVGLNPRHRLPELKYVVDDTDACLLIGILEFEDRDYRPDLIGLLDCCPSLRRLVTVGGAIAGHDEFYSVLSGQRSRRGGVERSSESRRLASRSPMSPRCVIYTSGSTGAPKGAVLADQGLVATHRELALRCGAPDFRIVSDFPVDHVAGIGYAYMALILGGTLYLRERFEPRGLVELIDEERITCWFPDLTQIVLSTEHFAARDFSHLDTLGYVGSPTETQLKQMRSISRRLITCYGMTETSDVVMVTDERTSDRDLLRHNVGRPIRRVAIRLWDPERDHETAGGDVGEIQVRGDCLLVSYLGQPDKTAKAFTADGWFRTGDLARAAGDGSYELVGRSDETFKSGGYNIYPREIELLLESHPRVARAAVVGVPHPVFRTVGYAFLQPRGTEPVSLDDIRGFSSERLANYKLPKELEIVDDMPRTRTDKIDKATLRKRAIERQRFGDAEAAESS